MIDDTIKQEQEQHRDTPGELTLEQALKLAIELHRTGDFDAADELYERILEIVPEQPDALHYSGVLALCRGDVAKALELVPRSVVLGPENADRYSNLGNVLVAAGRLAEASAAYRKAVALAPEHFNAHMNLGVMLGAQGRYQEAAQAHQRAIELNPASAEAYHNFGNMRRREGKLREAILYYTRSFTLDPQNRENLKSLALAYTTLGELDEAAAIYRRALESEPDDPEATHLLTACLGRDVPARASDGYIEKIFDAFAGRFDRKLQQLEYCAPQLVADALAKAVDAPRRSLTVLDAGCGTGLCGPLLAPYSARLLGVDLSAGMLEEARKRAVYGELVKEELTSFMANRAVEFDVIVAADTLCYFGALEAVLEAACGALRRGGVLVFTVEEAPRADAGYLLFPHGRYGHTEAYVERTLRECGFGHVMIDRAVLRFEDGAPVDGLVVTAAQPHEAARSAFAQQQTR
jgi:predicted TPR repeat methyltransferase